MRNPWKRSLETLIALVVIAALFTLLWVKVISVVEPQRPVPPMDMGPVPVQTATLESRSIPRELAVQGSLAPVRRAVLSLETGGRVVEVLEGWRAGRLVEAGELLARVDSAPAVLAWETARAQRDQAKAVLAAAEVEVHEAEATLVVLERALEVPTRERKRIEGLAATGEASAALVDQALRLELAALSAVQAGRSAKARAEAAVDSGAAALLAAEAILRQAADRRDRHGLTAAFPGLLTSAGPELGDLLAPLVPLGELVDTSRLLLLAQVHESQLAGLAIGQAVTVSLPSRPGLSLPGQVARLGVLADPKTRSLSVEIELDNREAGLPAGLFAMARVALEQLDDALWIDRSAFTWQGGRAVAFVLADGGQAEPRVLQLGEAVNEGFLIEAGLAAGDELILAPLDRLDPLGPTAVRAQGPERSQ
ncbi:MAG: efflux RND transporter periplasmic adaptor subunit [Planctomycetota bacterium]|nr:efflux RND transporter periplasmic adaptor subunit [Planctomycetota bacterium]